MTIARAPTFTEIRLAGCDGKERYVSYRQANAVLKRLRRRHKLERGAEAYRCPGVPVLAHRAGGGGGRILKLRRRECAVKGVFDMTTLFERGRGFPFPDDPLKCIPGEIPPCAHGVYRKAAKHFLREHPGASAADVQREGVQAVRKQSQFGESK